MQSYKNLLVWKKSIFLSKEIYKLTTLFPQTERFGLVTQMRRSAVSICSNIAEGRLRNSDKDFRRFLYIALGSAGELETQICISRDVLSLDVELFLPSEQLLQEVMPMLNTFITKLAPNG